jgi:hypothetical protein
MCLNSPYSEYFLARILELVDMGADGFYFDGWHMPKTGCWCKYCQEKFRAEMELPYPSKPDPSDPVWQKLVDFNNRTVERTFALWREAVHRRNPDVVMIVSSNTWTTMTDRHLTSRLFRNSDSVKTEFSVPIRDFRNVSIPVPGGVNQFEADVKLALGYTMVRDAADGRPAHIWTHGLLGETSAMYATAGILTHGCIVNLDVREENLPDPVLKKAFALGAKISPFLAGTIPLRWAGIHYPEHARDRYATRPVEAWERVLYPVYGSYKALLRAGLPVGIVTDSQLEDGSIEGYEVLFLPAPDGLTQPMQRTVQAFKDRGGYVIEQKPSWVWHDPSEALRKTTEIFIREVRSAGKSAPVQVLGGPEKMHGISYLREEPKHLIVCLTNDFSWVYTGKRPNNERKFRALSGTSQEPSPCRDVKIVLDSTWKPIKAFEAVNGVELKVIKSGSSFEIYVPDFFYLSVVVLNF